MLIKTSAARFRIKRISREELSYRACVSMTIFYVTSRHHLWLFTYLLDVLTVYNRTEVKKQKKGAAGRCCIQRNAAETRTRVEAYIATIRPITPLSNLMSRRMGNWPKVATKLPMKRTWPRRIDVNLRSFQGRSACEATWRYMVPGRSSARLWSDSSSLRRARVGQAEPLVAVVIGRSRAARSLGWCKSHHGRPKPGALDRRGCRRCR
jgi:hypothetical protein